MNSTASATLAGRELLFVNQPYSNHNGGQLAFGPNGRLYVGMGDGGSGGDASGVERTEYRINGGDWQTSQNTGGADPFETDFTLSAAGQHEVEYRSVDNAGNEETVKAVEYGARLFREGRMTAAAAEQPVQPIQPRNWLTLSLGISGSLLVWVVLREGLLDLVRASDPYIEHEWRLLVEIRLCSRDN